MRGYIKESRQVEEYGWKDHAAIVIRNYLIHHASIVDTIFHGLPVKRGQVVTSYSSIEKATGYTRQNVRSAMQRLVKQQAINMHDIRQVTRNSTCKPTCQGLLVTIENYDCLEDNPDTANTPANTPTDSESTPDSTVTQHHYNNKNEEEKNNFICWPAIPTLEEVKEYSKKIGAIISPVEFFEEMEQQEWKTQDGKPVHNWKAVYNSCNRKADREEGLQLFYYQLTRKGIALKTQGEMFLMQEIDKSSFGDVLKKLLHDKEFNERFKAANG